MTGINAEIAALKRRIYELERRVGATKEGAPPRPELGEITDDSPFQVTLSDGMVIEPSWILGANKGLVGDSALVVYPVDSDPVAIPPNYAATNLNELDDVVISSPSSGQVLGYNGTFWANEALSGIVSAEVFTTTYIDNSTPSSYTYALNTSMTVVSGRRYLAIGSVEFLAGGTSGTVWFTSTMGSAWTGLTGIRSSGTFPEYSNQVSRTGSWVCWQTASSSSLAITVETRGLGLSSPAGYSAQVAVAVFDLGVP